MSLRLNIKQLRQDGNTEYGLAALSEEFEKVCNAKQGERNKTLYASCLKLASLVASGQLREATVEDLMLTACSANGNRLLLDGDANVRATICQGLSNGKKNPRGPANDNKPDPKKEGITLVSFADVKAERISWLWEGVLAKFLRAEGPPSPLAYTSRPVFL